MHLANAERTPTSLTLAVSSPPQGKPFWLECTIEATLKDENNNPLPNMEIRFLYECLDHPGNWHLLGTAKTYSNGVSSLTYQLFDPFPDEMYNVTAMFGGTTNYYRSSSEKVAIARVVDYTAYLVGGGTIEVVIIGILGYIVFRIRRKVRFLSKPNQLIIVLLTWLFDRSVGIDYAVCLKVMLRNLQICKE
jgi:hypothetical protein